MNQKILIFSLIVFVIFQIHTQNTFHFAQLSYKIGNSNLYRLIIILTIATISLYHFPVSLLLTIFFLLNVNIVENYKNYKKIS